jgi:hypothetical protein
VSQKIQSAHAPDTFLLIDHQAMLLHSCEKLAQMQLVSHVVHTCF